MQITGLKCDKDLKQYRESMCHDSGTVIADAVLRTDDGKLYEMSLEVRGYVTVDQGDYRYRHASEMPADLVAAFADGSAYGDGKINIIENNWFEMMITELCPEGEYGYCDGIVVEEDFSQYTEAEMQTMFEQYGMCMAEERAA